MSAPLVFMDTETTGLSLDDEIWEFAAIRREPDGTGTAHHIFIEHSREKCKQLPESFRQDHHARYRDHEAYTPKQAASYIADVFRNGKPHVVGAVPNFDTERIDRLIGTHFPYTSMGWHYHLIDVENLAVGYLQGTLHTALTFGGMSAEDVKRALTPPWNSNQLSRAVGVDPDQFERHTAMGDVRWAMAIYDAVMAGAS